MPVQMYLGLIITLVIVLIMFMTAYRRQDGTILASMVIIGSAAGLSIGIKQADRSNIVLTPDPGITILSLWAFALLALLFTINIRAEVLGRNAATANITAEALLVKTSTAKEAIAVREQDITGSKTENDADKSLPELMIESFEALSGNNYEKAIGLLEKALNITKDLQTELKLRTELAFAYQLVGREELVKEQLNAALELAEKLGDNWVDDITAALKELANREKQEV